MLTADSSSPEVEVPEVVAELMPHRWKVRPMRLAHFTVQKWTPYGKPAASSTGTVGNAKPLRGSRNKQPVAQTVDYSRSLRPRANGDVDKSLSVQRSDVSFPEVTKPRDPRNDPVYALILKTIKS